MLLNEENILAEYMIRNVKLILNVNLLNTLKYIEIPRESFISFINFLRI